MNIIKNIKKTSLPSTFSKSISRLFMGTSANQYQIVKFLIGSSSDIAPVANILPSYFINIFFCKGLSIKDIVFDKKGNIYLTGFAKKDFELYGKKYKISQTGYFDVFIAKIIYQINRLEFLIMVPGINNDKAYSITIDKKNNLYICGYFTDSITFGTIYLHNSSSIKKQLFVAKFSTKIGEWIWAKHAGFNEYDSEAKFIKFFKNKIYLCGIFNDKISFDNNPLNIIENEGKNLFLSQMDPSDGEWEIFRFRSFNNQKIINFFIKNRRIFLYYLKYDFDENQNFLYFNIANTETLNFEISEESHHFNYLIDHFPIDKKKIIGFRDNIYIYQIDEFFYIIVNNKILKIIQLNGIISDACLDHQQNIIFIGHNFDRLMIGHCTLDQNNNFICKINNSGKIIYLDKVFAEEESIPFNKKTKIKKYHDFFYIIHSEGQIIKYHEDDRYLHCLPIVKSVGVHYFGDYLDIEINGKINYGFENLKPGFEYYIQENGEIDIISNNFYYGTAISGNEIIV